MNNHGDYAMASTCSFASSNGKESLVDEDVSLLLRETAANIVEQKTNTSKFLNPEIEEHVPRFDSKGTWVPIGFFSRISVNASSLTFAGLLCCSRIATELQLGRVLGRGTFCVAQEVVSMKLPHMKQQKSFAMFRRKKDPKPSRRQLEDEDQSINDGPSRKILAERCLRNGKPRYLIKTLKQDWQNENRGKITYMKGVVDLAMEAKFLSAFAHPNVIKLRAISKVGAFEEGFFVVLDRLSETLPKRMKRWGVMDRQSRGVTGSITGGKKKKIQLLIERLMAAHDIANALLYLHLNGIIYRDLVSTCWSRLNYSKF